MQCKTTPSDYDMFSLFTSLHDLELKEALPDVYKGLVAVLTMTLASVERNFSMLHRLKTYMRSTMEQNRLKHLKLLSVESGFLRELSTSPNFVDRVRGHEGTAT